MVDHHVVRLHVAVHDAHAMAVVQSLRARATRRRRSRIGNGTSCARRAQGVEMHEAHEEEEKEEGHTHLEQLIEVVAYVVVGQSVVQLLRARTTVNVLTST